MRRFITWLMEPEILTVPRWQSCLFGLAFIVINLWFLFLLFSSLAWLVVRVLS
jgi:hypothetical protein